MKDVSFLKNLEQEVTDEYNQLTKKVLEYFEGKYDSPTLILELNAFIDSLYAQYEQLITEYTNTLLSMNSSQECSLNEVISQTEEYIKHLSKESSEKHGE